MLYSYRLIHFDSWGNCFGAEAAWAYIRLVVSRALSHTTRLAHPLGLTSFLKRDFHGGDRHLP